MTSAADRLRLLPALVQKLISGHVLYRGIDWSRDSDERFDDDGREVTPDLELAQVVSSRTGHTLTEFHRPLIDLDIPCALVPSSTPGHHHLYIDKLLSWEQYVRLLDVLVDVGIVEPGFRNASLRRRCTFLRLPWVSKGQPARLTAAEIDAFLERPREVPLF